MARLQGLSVLNRHVLLVLEAILLHVDFTILLILRVLLRERDEGRRRALARIARVG